MRSTTGGPSGQIEHGDAQPGAVGSIRFDDVHYNYPSGLTAVAGLDLAVPGGTTMGIVGPSGCGKSTLLSLVSGLRHPTAGSVTVQFGQDRRHPLSMVFQKDTVLPWLTVEENIRLHFRFKKSARAQMEGTIRELIKLAHLEGFESAYPYQLSGGMRRRVAFLTAVAPMPEVLLLDEPFSALDEPSRISIHQDAYRIIREFGITMVLVTHDIAEAVSLCDRVAVLTSRPASVFEIHDMPFGTERDLLKIRETPDFLTAYGHLWSQLGAQIEKSASHGI